MPRGLVLCADDFGLTPGIDRAIVDLAGQGRLSAISCMTGGPHWRAHAPLLKPFIGSVDIGLHITLVDEKPITAMPLTAPTGQLPGIATMILKSHARLLDRAEIRREITAQWDAFEDALGRPPDHVDGHLHTHVFPDIRDVVFGLIQKRAPHAWLRNIAEPYARILRRGIAVPKAALLATLGQTFVERAGMGHLNDGFSGVYGLQGTEDIAALFARFLETPAKKPVVMCHPGDDANDADPIAAARTKEYQFLKSQAFTELLVKSGLKLSRFSAL